MSVKPTGASVSGLLFLFLAAGVHGDARAAWSGGLFGGDDEQAAPNSETLPYKVEIDDGGAGVSDAIRDASNLQKLKSDPPRSGDVLARRAAADSPGILDALWAEGYYAASVRVLVAGRALPESGDGLELAASAAEKLRGAAIVPVRIEAAPGAPYKIGTLAIIDSRTKAPLDPELIHLPARAAREGDQARAASVRELGSFIVDALRTASMPLAKIVETRAVARHRDRLVDVAIIVDPGPKAGIGRVQVAGAQTVDRDTLASFIYLDEGESYSPAKLAALRKSVGSVEIVGSVRILEAETLDANGNLPLNVVVGERKPHVVSLGAQYSTVDGPSARAAWTDRNLFGGGERLRLEAIAGVAAGDGGNPGVTRLLDPNRLTGRTGASFIKPGLWGSRNDLLADLVFAREITNTYTSTLVNATTAIRHRFDETLFVQGGLEFERGRSSDIFATRDYTLAGVTVSARYDTTDNAFDPTRGVRVIASASADPRALGSSINLYSGKAQASAYYAFDGEARTILAGRVAVGSLAGADTNLIPDNRRFFAGGGGSVRGFAWRSLSPTGPGGVAVGGRSLFEGSLEGRVKITETIGIVPFLDAGGAFAAGYPDFRGGLRFAAGLGLRYYTGFGPIRLDVATPLARRQGEAPVAVYVSVGQAF